MHRHLLRQLSLLSLQQLSLQQLSLQQRPRPQPWPPRRQQQLLPPVLPRLPLLQRRLPQPRPQPSLRHRLRLGRPKRRKPPSVNSVSASENLSPPQGWGRSRP